MQLAIIIGAKYLIYLALALVGLFWLKMQPLQRKRLVIFLLVSLPLTYLAGVLAREAYLNPRPFVEDGFVPLIPHEADNGFPSDHALLAGAVASALLFFNKRMARWLWIIAGAVSVSRVYAGVHHWIDILASFAIALLVASVVHVFIKWRSSDIMPQ